MDKHLTVNIKRLLGSPLTSEGKWGDAFVYQPPSSEDAARRGSLYVVVQLSSDTPSLHLAKLGEHLWETLRGVYYQKVEGSPLDALEESGSVAQEFLIKRISELPGKTSLEFDLAAVSLWGQVLYLAQLGSVQVYLRRDGKARLIAEGGEDNEITASSGILKNNDEVFIVTKGVELSAEGELLTTEDENAGDPHLGEAALKLTVDIETVPDEEEVVAFADTAEGESATGFITRVRVQFRRLLTNLVGRGKDIYVEKPPELSLRPSSSRSTQVIIGVLIVALVVSTLFTIRQRRRVIRTEAVDEALQLAEKNLQSAESLLDLNNLKARELLRESEQRLEIVSAYNIKTEEINNADVRIQTLFDRVANISRLEPQLIYDFSVQGEGVDLVDVAYSPSASTAFVADAGRRYIYELNIDSEPAIENMVANIDNPRLLVYDDNTVYMLTDVGFHSINVEDSSLSSAILELPDGSNWSAVDLYLANIYLLSTTDSQIYKFSPKGSAYSESMPWLEEDADLNYAISMAIDGNIFVLSSTGTVYKFAGGRKTELAVTNLDKPFEQPSDIATTVESRYLYVLDSGNSRAVVLDKEGRYQEQYLWESNLGTCKDLLLDELDKTVYLRCDNSFYSFNLNRE